MAAGGAEADGEAGKLRGAMAGQIAERYQAFAALFPGQRELGEGLPGSVVAALRKVPRHLFTPGVPLARAYEDDAVVLPQAGEGSAGRSPVSAPSMIALMLAQLDVRPGESVLEIGSGGYQAALLRELAGPGGSVTTLDIDPEVVSRARACLDRAGYGDVRTVCADGEYGAPGGGPFDKIIVAVEAWDVPPAWTGQLAPGGRLVVPLLTRGLPRSWALDRRDGHLVSRSDLSAYFVPMRGAGEYRTWSVPLDEAGVSLWGEEPQPAGVDRAALAAVLAAERCEARTGVTLPMGVPVRSGPDLWLVTDPDLCWLNAGMDAIDRGVVIPTGMIFRSGRLDTPALASGGSLAYYGGRPVDEDRTAVEYRACGHGPHGAELAERLAGHIQAWDREHRTGPGPVLTVHPASTPADDLPSGHVLNKRHSTIVLSWPEPAR